MYDAWMYRRRHMKKRRNCGMSCRLACGLLICAAVLLGPEWAGRKAQAAPKSAPTAESIREKEKEISQIKEQKEGLKDGLSDLQEIKKNLELQKDNLKN